MQDPEKEKFIREAIETIKHLKEEIVSGKKNHLEKEELMQRVKAVVADIQEKANQIFESNDLNLSPEELEVYLQNPSNFSKEDWILLEDMKKETAKCKKEIIELGEGEDAKKLLKKGKHNKRKARGPKNKA